MKNPLANSSISLFELFIAGGNRVVWLVAAYVLYRRFQEKRYLVARGLYHAQPPLPLETECREHRLHDHREWARSGMILVEEDEVYPEVWESEW